jgi:hypothetical protein
MYCNRTYLKASHCPPRESRVISIAVNFRITSRERVTIGRQRKPAMDSISRR